MKLNFWASVFFSLCTAFMIIMMVVNRQSTIDIQMHDTYFVVPSIQINTLFACYALFCAFIYTKMKGSKVLSWLIWFHMLSMVLVLFFYLSGIKTNITASSRYHYISTYGDLITPIIIMAFFILANIFFSYNFFRSRISMRKDA